MSKRGRIVLALAIVLTFLLAPSCKPATYGPIAPDAQPDSSCGFDEKLSEARMIRSPDGAAAVFPCDAGP